MLEGLKTATASIFPRSEYIRGAPESAELIEDFTDAELIIEELDGVCKDRKRKLISALKVAISEAGIPPEFLGFWEDRQSHTSIEAGLKEFGKSIKDHSSHRDIRQAYIGFKKNQKEGIDSLSKLERLVDVFIVRLLKSDLSKSNLVKYRNYLQDESIRAKIVEDFSIECVSKLEADLLRDSAVKGVYSLHGLALSGGGIRSATFCLGVLQKLADANILKSFDYVSSVSGGGFIGAGLLWWLRRNRRANEPQTDLHRKFPYGTADPSDPPNKSARSLILTYLRQSGNYLIPGNGITLWSSIVAVIRTVLLNLIVWIPLSMGLFIILHYVDDIVFGVPTESARAVQDAAGFVFLEPATYGRALFYTPLVAAGLAGAIFLVYCLGHSLVSTKETPEALGPNIKMSNLGRFSMVLLATVFFALAFFGAISEILIPTVSKFLDSVNLDAIKESIKHISLESGSVVRSFVVFVIVLIGMLVLLVPTSLSIRGIWDYDKSEEAGYISRRAFERYFGEGFIPFIVLIAIATIPLVFQLIGNSIEKGGLYGVISVSAGAGTAIFGHLKAREAKEGTRLTEITLIGGAVLLIYGIGLLGYSLSWLYLKEDTSSIIRAALLTLFVIAIFSGLFTNINGIALHQYYRDRLMEAFMPDYSAVRKGVNAPAREADGFLLKDITSPEIFPIINTNVILVKSACRKYLNRGGDNFILTPKRCGSNATGWSKTQDFRGGKLSLATAVAISGAAANPNAGVGGAGVTRNRVVSLAMLLLALRLGYWVESPAQRSKRVSTKNPNHFYPAAAYSWGWTGYNENSHFLELSDGGHFENLGLYELVRRRCGLILLCDGGRDALASYSDFINAIRRVEEDFGAQFIFEPNCGPELLISSLPDQPTYPRGAEYSRQGHFIARIKYNNRGGNKGEAPWPEEGILIYLKSSMIKNVSLKAKGYKGAHPDFPDESTGDQFFDEEQFEAYRELGYRIASEMIEDLEEAKGDRSKAFEIFEGAEAIVKTWKEPRGETRI